MQFPSCSGIVQPSEARSVNRLSYADPIEGPRSKLPMQMPELSDSLSDGDETSTTASEGESPKGQGLRAVTHKDAKAVMESQLKATNTRSVDQELTVPDLDFIMPLKAVGLICQAVVESLFKHYSPRRIYIISVASEIRILKAISAEWDVPPGALCYVEEDSFFVESFGMTRDEFKPFYVQRDATKAREFGWWWQQLLKLGAFQCIPDLSDNFYVWDGDLIVLKPWSLAANRSDGSTAYHIAILQEAARSDFNREQYRASVKHILGTDPIAPPEGGTFVAHHMVFNRAVIRSLIEHIDLRLPGEQPWPAKLLATSEHHYRMSEYMLYSTWVLTLQMEGTAVPFAWHSYGAYGKSGIRQREPQQFLEALAADRALKTGQELHGHPINGYSFKEIVAHLQKLARRSAQLELPSHLQLEHVYGLGSVKVQ